MKRASLVAFWIGPPLVCLLIYWVGLKAWFQQDDFAWLQLRQDILDGRNPLVVLFEPRAQGTIRPLSERAFFIVFSAIFGLDPIPFRIWVYLTQFANLALLGAITLRLTGSRLAGFCAPIFWLANSGLAKVMTWTSAYNQVLCAFFLLLSFQFLLLHVETGRRRYWIAQWAAFLLGFGAQELNVFYPVLAAAYTLCCARGYFRKTLPLFVPSILYVIAHAWAAPKVTQGVYGLYFDSAILATFGTYWSWALTAVYFEPAWLRWTLASLLTAALVAFTIARARRRDWVPVFLLVWCLLMMAPVLPLREHITEYYVALPALGLAMLGAWSFVSGLRRGGLAAIAALLLAGTYLAVSLPATRSLAWWNYRRSREVRTLVRGVARAQQLHPGKVILLAGVSDDLFWTGVVDEPFRLVGAESVYLAPGSEASIQPRPGYGELTDFILPPGAALRLLEDKSAVIYAISEDRLYNVTSLYEEIASSLWAPEEPRFVDVAQPIFAPQLGPTWYESHGRHRWMPKRATVRLGGPRTAAEKLYVEGYCPAEALAKGPVELTLSMDGKPLPPVLISRPNQRFEFSFPLPAESIGKKSVELAVEVDRTFVVPSEKRELGLVFGTFAIR